MVYTKVAHVMLCGDLAKKLEKEDNDLEQLICALTATTDIDDYGVSGDYYTCYIINLTHVFQKHQTLKMENPKVPYQSGPLLQFLTYNV